MSFRQIPFQFSTTDPVERQRELEKRFGVPSQNKMYIDAANPLTMDSGLNASTNSPRFQHRVPMFDGMPAQSSVDCSASENKTPKVRVIPIEIENDVSSPSSRHRTFSGPAEITKQHNKEIYSQKDDASTLKRSMEDLSKPSKMKAASGPRVYNIPIKVEQSGMREKKTKLEKGKMPAMKPHSKVNGCDVSKNVKNVEPEPSPKEAELTEERRMNINIDDSLKKIDRVLEELKSYETGVNNFNGTDKDKQYRYLDEMLTRCMIKLDDIETMGNEEVRSARKKVVKMVQACIDLLESKVNNANKPGTSVNINNATSVETSEKQDNAERSTVLEVENSKQIDNVLDISGENRQVENANDSTLPQNKSLISDAPSSECKSNVPEVEMAEVTSTSSHVNLDENSATGISAIDQSQTVATNTISEVLAQPSESNEIEMTEVITQNNSQDQKELAKPEVSSTNILHFENISVDSAPLTDSNEAEMTDISSTLNYSSEIQKDAAISKDSSSTIQSESIVSNIEQFPAETEISENCEVMKTVETDNYSSSDSNLQSSIPEVEMKDVHNSRNTNNTTILDDERSNLQSNCISSNESN